MTPEEIAERITALKAKLKARDNKPGYKTNCDELRAEIARLEGLNGDAA